MRSWHPPFSSAYVNPANGQRSQYGRIIGRVMACICGRVPGCLRGHSAAPFIRGHWVWELASVWTFGHYSFHSLRSISQVMWVKAFWSPRSYWLSQQIHPLSLARKHLGSAPSPRTPGDHLSSDSAHRQACSMEERSTVSLGDSRLVSCDTREQAIATSWKTLRFRQIQGARLSASAPWTRTLRSSHSSPACVHTAYSSSL